MRLLHTGPGGTTLADINYTYDNVNNRLSKTDVTTSSHDPSGTDAMSFDAANELLNLNSTTYSYDPNGNRIQKTETSGITTYTYDEENRLTRVEISGTSAQVITYAYDPFGRRIQKNVNGTITNYVYDKDAIILEYNQAGTVQTRYTHGLGIDEPLSMDNNSQMYYYHADGLGSVVALTNASGGVAQRYDYDAFGNITSGAPTITQPYTYTAREYDPETGLYFYRARYYDPKAGRFLQRDPIGFAGGLNVYSYVNCNPANLVDPTGYFPWACHIKCEIATHLLCEGGCLFLLRLPHLVCLPGCFVVSVIICHQVCEEAPSPPSPCPNNRQPQAPPAPPVDILPF